MSYSYYLMPGRDVDTEYRPLTSSPQNPKMSTSTAPRTRTACGSCTRRKVRCSKTFPCETCVRRGEEDSCGPDAGPLPSQSMLTTRHHDSVTSELEFLQRRVRELENQTRMMSAEKEPAVSSPDIVQLASAIPEVTNDDIDDSGEDSVEAQDDDHIVTNDDTIQTDSRRDTSDTVIKDAASILEFLAWGRRKDPEYHPTTHGRRSSVGDGSSTAVSSSTDVGGVNIGMAMIPVIEESDNEAHLGEFGGHGHTSHNDDPFSDSNSSSVAVLQMLLPSQRQVEQLVDYHIECLLWYHASFLAPRFRTELALFYDKYGGQVQSVEDSRGTSDIDLQWMALLFSILSGSLTCAPSTQALSWGFHAPERHALCKHWFQAALACLQRDQYMANHSIRSCQTIATMTISAHMLGFSNTQSIQLAAAVRIAQSLGLHRLGGGDRGAEPVTADIEQGRRVWNQLCSQDWFGIPFSESYLVNPLHSQTAKPANVHDEDLELSLPVPVQPETEPTVSGYCRFLNTIASIMPRLQDGLLACNTAYTRYQQVLSWDAHMRTLATADRPRFLSSQVPLEQHWPVWIPWARRALAISSGHKIIMIHRSFLSESFTNPAFSFTRHTCIAASKTIIKEYKAVAREEGPTLWVHQAFSVAASIILILDVLHRGPGDDQARQSLEHANLVEDVVGILRQFPHSMIAVRGIRLLKALLDEAGVRDVVRNEAVDITPISPTDARKRKRGQQTNARHSFSSTRDLPPLQASSKKTKFNVPAFIRHFCQTDKISERRQSHGRPNPRRRVHNAHSSTTSTLTMATHNNAANADKRSAIYMNTNNNVGQDRVPDSITLGSDMTVLPTNTLNDPSLLDAPIQLPPGWDSSSNGFENLLYLANHDFSLL